MRLGRRSSTSLTIRPLSHAHEHLVEVGGCRARILAAVNVHLALAASAAVISFAFALSALERWDDRRKPHEAAWAASLFLFTAAAVALLAGVAMGWNALSFRCFFLFGAIVNVPYLGLGTVWLLGGPKWGRPATAVVHAFALFAAGVITVAPLTGAIPTDRLPQG